MIALGVPLGLTLRDRVNEEVRFQARGEADVVAATAADLLHPLQRAALTQVARSAAASVRGRISIVDERGRLVADSAASSEIGASYAPRPEIASALAGRSRQLTRFSRTLKTDLLATAVPIRHGSSTGGAVRITQSVAAVHRAVLRSILELVLLAAIVLALGLGAGWFIARRVAGPVRRLEATARRIAGGSLAERAPVEGASEQRSLARSFNDMTSRLMGALDAQQTFVADASHQLRTPLTGLRLRLEEAQAAAHNGGHIEDELEAGMTELDRVSAIVDELLVLSRAGERSADAEEVDLAAVARETAERWQPTARERDISLVARDGRGGHALVARSDLERALDALVENAVAYAPAGSAVEVIAGPHTIEVLDTGPGLAPDEQEDVFKRFHRGSAGRAGPSGSGLGLPIARELMRAWRGDATLENRPAGGARAAISLPDLDKSWIAPR